MRIGHVLTAILLATAAAGCSSVAVKSNYDRSASFDNLHTFAWRPGDKAPTGDPRFDSPELDAQIRAAVDHALASKGYRLAAPGSTPDFLVGYHAAVRQQTGAQTIDRWYGVGTGGWGGWPETYTHEYDEGTLLIDVLNPETMKLMWRGYARGVVDPRAKSAKRTERINDAVERMLAEFPPH